LIIVENKRIALLIPHTDTTLELDLKRELPKNISLHVERMYLKNVSKEAELIMRKEEMPRAIGYLRDIKPNFCIFGCTSASAIGGVEGEKKLKKDIKKEIECDSITAFGAVLDTFKENKSKKIAVFAPYTYDLTEGIVGSIVRAGFNVHCYASMNLLSDYQIGKISPSKIIEFVLIHKKEINDADMIFISCTNLRAFECIDYLEKKLNKKVVTSNYAILKLIDKNM